MFPLFVSIVMGARYSKKGLSSIPHVRERQLESLEERKRIQLEIIEKQKQAGIRIEGDYCFCQECDNKVKLHKPNPNDGYYITCTLTSSPLDDQKYVCSTCWIEAYEKKHSVLSPFDKEQLRLLKKIRNRNRTGSSKRVA